MKIKHGASLWGGKKSEEQLEVCMGSWMLMNHACFHGSVQMGSLGLGRGEQVEELWNWLAQGGCFDSFHNMRIDFVIAIVGFAA